MLQRETDEGEVESYYPQWTEWLLGTPTLAGYKPCPTPGDRAWTRLRRFTTPCGLGERE